MRRGVVSRLGIRYTASVIAVMAVCVLWCVPTFAATRTWTGATDSDWTKAANWGGTVPVGGDTANIPGGLTNYPIITGAITVGKVFINSAGSGASLTVSSGSLTIGDINVNATGTLTVSGGSIFSSGNFTVDGTVTLSSGVIHMASTIGSAPNDNIIIDAGGVFNQSGGTVATKDFTTDAGSPPGTYNQTGGTFKMYHDFKNSGAFNGTGGTVEFNGQAGGGAFPSTTALTQFFNVVINADPHFDEKAVTIGVGGNWTSNLTGPVLDLGNKANMTIKFNGNGPQAIGGFSVIFRNVIVDKPSGTATLTNNQDINNGNLTVTSGTLDLSSFRMDRVSNGGTLTVANGAFLQIGGTNSFPVRYVTHTLGPTSTVEYNGTTQIVTSELYGHLILSGSSTKTMPNLLLTTQGNFTMAGTASATLAGVLEVDGNFTLNANTTFGAAVFNHSVKGNFTNSGTFNAGTSTTTLDGTQAQTIGGSNSTTFNLLTINNPSGVVLNGVNATVNNTLTFTSGTITTGATRVIIPLGASVSRTSGHVVGNLQKHFITGAPTATFEVGSATAYTPINISFAAVSVAGDLIASTTTGDHPNLGSSNISPAKTANRYWTLTNSGIGFTNYNATFNFVPADVDAGANTANFIVARYSSGWTYPAVGTKTPTSTQATGLTAFSDFQVGDGGPPIVGLVKSVSPSGIQQPGTDLAYTAVFTNSGSSAAATVAITDAIPANTDFKVGSETHNLGTTGLTVAVTYSNNGGTTYAYTPASGGGGAPAGYDRNVTNLRWTFTGSLSQTSPNNTGSVSFTTRIR